jgi:nucleoporin NUP82
MPRVIKRTPEWLVPPSPGHSLFNFKAAKSPSSSGTTSQGGSLRTIAKGRGSEVFVASGNELRWADLGALKQDFQEAEETRIGAARTTYHYAGDADTAYRVCGGGKSDACFCT